MMTTPGEDGDSQESSQQTTIEVIRLWTHHTIHGSSYLRDSLEMLFDFNVGTIKTYPTPQPTCLVVPILLVVLTVGTASCLVRNAKKFTENNIQGAQLSLTQEIDKNRAVSGLCPGGSNGHSTLTSLYHIRHGAPDLHQ